MAKLPRVSPGVCAAVSQEMTEDPRRFSEEMLHRLQHENPIIAQWLNDWMRVVARQHHTFIAETAIGIYRLLESQLEADEMNQP